MTAETGQNLIPQQGEAAVVLTAVGFGHIGG
jgi:hypothetical protein